MVRAFRSTNDILSTVPVTIPTLPIKKPCNFAIWQKQFTFWTLEAERGQFRLYLTQRGVWECILHTSEKGTSS